MLEQVKQSLREHADPEHAKVLQKFFKTGKGEYGEGDKFLGIRVPATRNVARKFRLLPTKQVELLMTSSYHEERLLALVILIHQFERAAEDERRSIYEFYLNHTQYVNNWDLVDISAHKILGPYLFNRSHDSLFALVDSSSIWERRISIMSTYYFIKRDRYDTTLKLALKLLKDAEDLIHKAVGWMLRELGKRDQESEILFLNKHYKVMPRTMLRYAIEKFPEDLRQAYLKGTV